MKFIFEFVFSRVIGILLLSIAGSALGQGVFPPNGQLPALWAIPPGATAGWNVASDAASEGTFSLRSAPLAEDPAAPADQRKTAAIEAGGTFSAGNISFAYQVSSEAGFDLFQFYIDGQLIHEDSGIVNFKTVSFPVPAGYHTFKWVYNKDNSLTVGSDAAWIDAVVLPSGTLGQQFNVARTGPGKGTVSSSPTGITCGAICTGYFAPGSTVTLSATPGPGSTFGGWGGACAGTQSTCAVVVNAVKSVTALFNLVDDNFPLSGAFPGAPWSTPSDSAAPWRVAGDATYAGSFSLKSGIILDNQPSSIQVTQPVGSGTIDFAYKVSSEAFGDTFAFYIDDVLQQIDSAGVRQFPASGEVDWRLVSFNVSPGTHIFRFQYQKDADTVAGSDSAWIDAVSFPTTRLLTITKAGSGSGTITSNNGAINCGATCTASLDINTLVTLTPTPASGSTFAGWLGACTGLFPTDCQVTMSRARDVTASFSNATQLSLTVNKAGNGTGTVTSSPAGIDCGVTCSASYVQNTLVNLQALADSSSTFTGWAGACSGTGACQVTMDAAKSVTATFAGPILSVSKSGSGTVTSTPAGIDCGATCSASFSPNQLVTLNASPAAGSNFAGWTGACSGTGSCQVTMDFAKSVSASFSVQGGTTSTLTVTIQGNGSGTVTSNVGGINCGMTCSTTLNNGTSVQLTASAAAGSVFTGWTGGCIATSTTCTLTLNQATTVFATFSVPGASGLLDVDGSSPTSKYDALTDGLLVIRYLFGLTGTPLINGALSPSATRNTATAVKAYLDGIRPQLDVDGNGTPDALTDGLLIIRYMFGLRGSALVAGAVGSGAARSTSVAIEAYIQSLMP